MNYSALPSIVSYSGNRVVHVHLVHFIYLLTITQGSEAVGFEIKASMVSKDLLTFQYFPIPMEFLILIASFPFSFSGCWWCWRSTRICQTTTAAAATSSSSSSCPSSQLSRSSGRVKRHHCRVSVSRNTTHRQVCFPMNNYCTCKAFKDIRHGSLVSFPSTSSPLRSVNVWVRNCVNHSSATGRGRGRGGIPAIPYP